MRAVLILVSCSVLSTMLCFKHAQAQGVVDSCDPGHYYSSVSNKCEPCPANTYQDEPGQTSCIQMTICKPGEKVLAAFEGSPETDRRCDNCEAAKFSTKFNVLSCDPWKQCLAGEYVPIEGQPTRTSQRICLPCPPNTFQEMPNQLDPCAPWADLCSAGTRETQEPSATNNRVCELCPSGYFQDEVDKTFCKEWDECPEGIPEIPGSASPSTDRLCASTTPTSTATTTPTTTQSTSTSTQSSSSTSSTTSSTITSSTGTVSTATTVTSITTTGTTTTATGTTQTVTTITETSSTVTSSTVTTSTGTVTSGPTTSSTITTTHTGTTSTTTHTTTTTKTYTSRTTVSFTSTDTSTVTTTTATSVTTVTSDTQTTITATTTTNTIAGIDPNRFLEPVDDGDTEDSEVFIGAVVAAGALFLIIIMFAVYWKCIAGGSKDNQKREQQDPTLPTAVTNSAEDPNRVRVVYQDLNSPQITTRADNPMYDVQRPDGPPPSAIGLFGRVAQQQPSQGAQAGGDTTILSPGRHQEEPPTMGHTSLGITSSVLQHGENEYDDDDAKSDRGVQTSPSQPSPPQPKPRRSSGASSYENNDGSPRSINIPAPPPMPPPESGSDADIYAPNAEGIPDATKDGKTIEAVEGQQQQQRASMYGTGYVPHPAKTRAVTIISDRGAVGLSIEPAATILDSMKSGVVVRDVTPGGAADRAGGIEIHDQLMAVGGVDVSQADVKETAGHIKEAAANGQFVLFLNSGLREHAQSLSNKLIADVDQDSEDEKEEDNRDEPQAPVMPSAERPQERVPIMMVSFHEGAESPTGTSPPSTAPTSPTTPMAPRPKEAVPSLSSFAGNDPSPGRPVQPRPTESVPILSSPPQTTSTPEPNDSTDDEEDMLTESFI